MRIHLTDITPENWAEAAQLQVWEHQKHLAPPAVGLLARAYAWRKQRARVIAMVAEERLAGLMLVRDGADCYELITMLVDWRQQGKGVAQAALTRLMNVLQREGRFACVTAAVPAESEVARHVLEKVGFSAAEGDAERMTRALGAAA